MPVNSKDSIYRSNIEEWRKMRDTAGGTPSIKAGGTKYLPALGGQQPEQYKAYLNRAQFYNATARTIGASAGQIFRKEPVVYDLLESFIDDIDLCGTNLYYFARNMADELLTVPRFGILIDYSDEEKRPYLTAYTAESIINVREERINGKTVLSLVVLEGMSDQPKPGDEFSTNSIKTWRVLKLEEGRYVVRDYIIAEDKKQGEDFQLVSEYWPIMNDQPMTWIPFYICTPYGLSTIVKPPVFADLAELNRGHYRNSADYENMLHWSGVKTVITKGWGNKQFPLGGNADFKPDGDAKYLEANSDSSLLNELRHKEELMAVLGSVTMSGRGKYVQSAESARVTSAGDYATLADISNAMTNALTVVLKDLMAWAGEENKNTAIKFNTDFELEGLNAQDLIAWMSAVQAGFMSDDTFYSLMDNKEAYPHGWNKDKERQAIEETKSRIRSDIDNGLAAELNGELNG